LTAAGRGQYEISNFARHGFESRHNKTYWRNEPYYGLGAGAHGYARGVRHMNIKGVQPYIDKAAAGLPRLETHAVAPDEAMEDFMMVGLRLLAGVREQDFARQFGERESLRQRYDPILRRLIGLELLEKTPQADGYRLTSRGVMLGNEVFGAFLA